MSKARHISVIQLADAANKLFDRSARGLGCQIWELSPFQKSNGFIFENHIYLTSIVSKLSTVSRMWAIRFGSVQDWEGAWSW